MSFTWRSDSPPRRRRGPRSRPPRPRSRADGSTIRRPSAYPRCASGSRGIIATPMAAMSMPDRIVVTTGSSGAFILAFLAMFEPGDRVAVTVPGYPPYRHILTALGCEPVLIETTSETRHALTGEALLAAHRKTPLKGVLVGSPANPTGTMMSREALNSLIAAAEDAGIRFISDEIYHGLDYAFPAVTAAELSPRCARDQLVLEIFLHDRLAGRLDGGAGAAGAPDRTAAAESRDLGADAVADRSRSRLRRPRGDGGDQARLSGKPPHPDRGPAAGRPDANSCPRTARSTFMPTSPTSPRTASNSPRRCSSRRMSRRPPASTSIPFTAATSSASPMRARPTTCARRSSGSHAGCANLTRRRGRAPLTRPPD